MLLNKMKSYTHVFPEAIIYNKNTFSYLQIQKCIVDSQSPMKFSRNPLIAAGGCSTLHWILNSYDAESTG